MNNLSVIYTTISEIKTSYYRIIKGWWQTKWGKEFVYDTITEIIFLGIFLGLGIFIFGSQNLIHYLAMLGLAEIAIKIARILRKRLLK